MSVLAPAAPLCCKLFDYFLTTLLCPVNCVPRAGSPGSLWAVPGSDRANYRQQACGASVGRFRGCSRLFLYRLFDPFHCSISVTLLFHFRSTSVPFVVLFRTGANMPIKKGLPGFGLPLFVRFISLFVCFGSRSNARFCSVPFPALFRGFQSVAGQIIALALFGPFCPAVVPPAASDRVIITMRPYQRGLLLLSWRGFRPLAAIY